MNIITHIGLDVHKVSIDVALASNGDSAVEYYGAITNDEKSIGRLVKKLEKTCQEVKFYYEAGPCGYGLYRYLRKRKKECVVVAPSLIPKKPGERVKTNRKDAQKLARLGRAGELTGVAVPSEDIEALREVVRAREDAVLACRRAKQHILSFLLRHDYKYSGKSNWTKSFYTWVEKIRFDTAEQNIVLQDYYDTIMHCEKRILRLEEQLQGYFETWELKPVLQALMALRGIDIISAMGIIAEVGDFRRFQTAQEFMSYVGLTPSEYSSGENQKRGGITKCGNSHLRRILVESAWCAHHVPRKTAHWKAKAKYASEIVQEISWKASQRLHKRYCYLLFKGKPKTKVITAVARELAGFVWAVAIQASKEMEEVSA